MSAANRSRTQQEQAAYGWSLLLQDGDLALQDGALLTVTGRQNLEQAIVCRIRTPWASDSLTVTYGLDAAEVFTTGLSRDLAKQVLRLNLVRTVAGDPRVAEIRSVLFDDDPEYLAQHPDAAGISNRRLALVEISVRPVPTAPSTAPPTLGGDDVGDSVSVLAEVRW